MNTSCGAVREGFVRTKGKASIEFYIDDKPQYYCEGYISLMNDELISPCRECKKHVSRANEDLQRSKK